LLDMILRKKHIRGTHGDFIGSPGKIARETRQLTSSHLEVSSMRAEQTNSSVIYGDRFILKLFRQIEEGINPDLEIGRFLTEQAHFPAAPAIAGDIEYRTRDKRRFSAGILQDYVPNE